ncbi:30S ribosomal protein S9, putative [Plasmodium berghei]|uniref:30S ribosomal protein S9, putative n=2 Tax=Plasmodium berghei TaxID=5821 RepID=A0A509AL54_PLABA|nr:30S ribosomal protein S9, putative [Plasmodium berghei ANKA]CXI54989.1 30S ribosomal protein S9, putative [Plasmodium berghei]SCL95079.1 30S ribosomal protein S9, putative [Plasmodium berghei]SCM16168.1 30S ribosomal protein S9, putative [Plasmodium berghei]SCM17964.1 30S ribosomal protein S9, putative [Plasmodium berghei]SCN26344.1 30S ribosomal protein S9, putative [Plasmodium berghei]|eukprot:XP_034422092.1 30S ribosomal protein S9, putative [Plasmodium berghei ANKA]
MFLNHANSHNIIFIFICIFFYYKIFHHILLQNVGCKKISKSNNFFHIGNIEYGDDFKLLKLKTWNSIKKEDKKNNSLLYNISKIPIRNLGNTFFIFNKPINIITHTKRKKKKNFNIFKKKKDKGESAGNVKKKPKKTFTEEEIEELRKKAKEKLQPKKEEVTTGKGGKRGKKKKKSEDFSKPKNKEKDENEENETNDKLKDEIKTEKIEYIKSRNDFEQIVGSTTDIISEKEIEYLHKISNKDNELLNYDKKEKYIELNYEDTIFDEGNYMQNYVNNISKFRFDIFNINNKNEFDRITKYLNYEYIEHIPIDFPTEKSYNIELKTYFYEIVCDLIKKNKEKFYHENMEIGDIDEGKFNKVNEEKEKDENEYKIEAKKGKINNSDEENDNNTLNNFLKENSEGNKNFEVNNKNDNILKIIKPTDQDIMNKYMSIDLYNILCDIKEEYDFMFNNGGLANFSFDENRKTNKEKLIFSGKKKRAIASVFLQKGNNNLIINNRDGYQYLQYQIFNINKIFSPLLHLCMNRNFNVVAHVEGGGLTGQSVAIFHALVKYIVYNFSLKIKPFFRSFKFMTVDSRKVERKKYGLKKARKKKQYSKR